MYGEENILPWQNIRTSQQKRSEFFPHIEVIDESVYSGLHLMVGNEYSFYFRTLRN